jgi:hypothetical protein
MWRTLNQPLWPQSRFSLTTPLSLLLTAGCLVGGGWLYGRGFTYEGAAIGYMLGGIFLFHPYYSAQYTGYMTWLILMCFVPMSIWLQNKGVETMSWHYRPREEYLAWITKSGEGRGHWTRHLWLGNDMPAMEYAFYLLFGMFQMTLYSFYSHLLPNHWFERPRPRLKWIFPVLFPLLFAGFVGIFFMFPKPGKTDYLYWLTGVGYVVTIAAFGLSRNYRDYARSRAYWLWVVGMGGLFMPVWEWFHSCRNHDWVYNLDNTFPPAYVWRGAGVPISEFFGYLTTATTFQALILLFVRRFGKSVIRDYDRVPFSRS